MIKEVVKKSLVVGVILLFSGTVFASNISSNMAFYGDELDQQQTIWTEYEGYGIHNSDEMMAQSFKPTLSVLTRVELAAGNFGNPSGNLVVSIRSSLNGEDLTSAYVSAQDIPDLEHSDWMEFDFSDISTTPEETYYIVWHPDSSWDSSNFVIWRKHDGDPYPRGRLFWYDGSDWVDDYPTEDFCFKTYGMNNQPPNKPSITGPTSGEVRNSYEYEIVADDPDGDNLYYFIEFEEGYSYWTEENYPSGEAINRSWRWSESGDYEIKVKAKDVHGLESDWATLKVSIPKNKDVNPILRLLGWPISRFPLLEMILFRMALLNNFGNF